MLILRDFIFCLEGYILLHSARNLGGLLQNLLLQCSDQADCISEFLVFLAS